MTESESALLATAAAAKTVALPPAKVGIAGSGMISGAYAWGISQFEILDLVACADVDLARARWRAEESEIPRACTVDELLADPEIEIVCNFTPPQAHAEVSLAAIEAGKHVFSEKPFAASRDEGRAILAAAERRDLLVGCAPDTVLGGGVQTCRKLLDDGWIGDPVAATAIFLGGGHEGWHPRPEPYYKKPGGGPVMDMGPYYLTALVVLLGPIARVTARARTNFPQRIVTSEPSRGAVIDVEVPTHVTGIAELASGQLATVAMSYDVWAHSHPLVEIYGSEGTLTVPDPNRFGGTVRLQRSPSEEWHDVPLTHSGEVDRGIGVADLAYAIRTGRPHRVSGELAFHVLDVMCALEESAAAGEPVAIQSSCERPAPLPLGLRPGTLDG